MGTIGPLGQAWLAMDTMGVSQARHINESIVSWGYVSCVSCPLMCRVFHGDYYNNYMVVCMIQKGLEIGFKISTVYTKKRLKVVNRYYVY